MEIGRHRRTLQVEPLDATQPATVGHAPAVRRESDGPEPVAVTDASPGAEERGRSGRLPPPAEQPR